MRASAPPALCRHNVANISAPRREKLLAKHPHQAVPATIEAYTRALSQIARGTKAGRRR